MPLLDGQLAKVRFRWNDYRDGNRRKTMTLAVDEFIRRFLIHVLPQGFQRIRYFGFLGNRYRQQHLDQCRQLLGVPEHKPYDKPRRRPTGINSKRSPAFHSGIAIRSG